MRRSPFALAAGALATGAALLASASPAAGQDIPNVSKNVNLLFNVPDPGMISGTFARTGNFFYSSGLGDLRVYDTTDPRRPVPMGAVVAGGFENEAMTYGERLVGGQLKRYIFFGNDLVQAGAGGTAGPKPAIGRINGREVVVFDVSNPQAPTEVKRIRTLSSTHTLQCVTSECRYAYTAGDGDNMATGNDLTDDEGFFSVLDLTSDDPANWKELKTVESPAAKGPFAAGHYWDFDGQVDSAGRRLGWHTGGGGAAVFNVTDPVNPVLLNSTNPDGTSDIEKDQTANFNDFILHNSMRPNATAFTGNQDSTPSVFNGNVLIATEEDYLNTSVGGATGQELVCQDSGSIETWLVDDLAGGGDTARNFSGAGSFSQLDKLNPVQSLPTAAGFCSAHWFDYHQDGFLAQGFYQGGLQIIDVRNATDLKSFGFFRTPAATEVWDAYFVPVRDQNGVDTGQKTNVVYTADAVKGLDVFEVNLPNDPTDPTGPGEPVVPEVPVAALVPLVAAVVLGGAVVLRRRRADTLA